MVHILILEAMKMKFDFVMHSESNVDSESKEKTMNNEILYTINEEDFDDSDSELV